MATTSTTSTGGASPATSVAAITLGGATIDVVPFDTGSPAKGHGLYQRSTGMFLQACGDLASASARATQMLTSGEVTT